MSILPSRGAKLAPREHALYISTIESRAAPTLTRYSFTPEIQFLRPVSQRSYFRQSDSYHYCCRLVRKVLPQKRAMRGQVSRCFE